MFPLEAKQGTVVGFPDFPRGWRLYHTNKGGGVMILIQAKRDLRFGCQQDCERAIQAFEEEGHKTMESLAALSDQERARIATKYLRW